MSGHFDCQIPNSVLSHGKYLVLRYLFKKWNNTWRYAKEEEKTTTFNGNESSRSAPGWWWGNKNCLCKRNPQTISKFYFWQRQWLLPSNQDAAATVQQKSVQSFWPPVAEIGIAYYANIKYSITLLELFFSKDKSFLCKFVFSVVWVQPAQHFNPFHARGWAIDLQSIPGSMKCLQRSDPHSLSASFSLCCRMIPVHKSTMKKLWHFIADKRKNMKWRRQEGALLHKSALLLRSWPTAIMWVSLFWTTGGAVRNDREVHFSQGFSHVLE